MRPADDPDPPGSRTHDQAEAEDFEHVQDLVQAQALLAVLDGMDEARGTAGEVGDLGLTESEVAAAPADGVGKIGDPGDHADQRAASVRSLVVSHRPCSQFVVE
jgi:hypothetical protein